MSAALCPLTRCRGVLVIEVARGGVVVTTCPRCERRRAGICRDCPRRVAGAVGRSLRCAEHTRRARLDADAKHRRDPEVKRRINARDRKRRREDAAYREQRRERSRRWSATHKAEKKRAARRYLLSEGPSRERYLATQRRHNADPVRAQRKRDHALQRYYERHPVRPTPHCAGCGGRLAWRGTGKPPKWCDSCCLPAERSRRQRVGRSIVVISEPVTAGEHAA